MPKDVSRRPPRSNDVYAQFVAAFAEIPTRAQWESFTGLFVRMSDRERKLLADFLADWYTPNVRRQIAGGLPQPWAAVFDAAFGEQSAPFDVAVFNRLLAIWHKMWDDIGRYGPAGLKIRRGLIVFLALIFVTLVLDVALAQADLTDHQLTELAAVEGALAVGATLAKKQ